MTYSSHAQRRVSFLSGFALLSMTVLAAPARGQSAGEAVAQDSLGAELDRWAGYLDAHPDSGELWSDIRASTEPIFRRTEQAYRGGHRYLALSRLLVAYPSLAAAAFMDRFPQEQLQDSTAFLGVWRQNRAELERDLDPVVPTELEGIRPAALRAIAEVALPQVREYYNACADYGRATTPASGFFYLGYARAQRDFTALCRTWSEDAGSRPKIRPMDIEIEQLQDAVLRDYRPPTSIDRHGEFVLVGSYLKEARELTAMGLHDGALLRYLQAVLRSYPLRVASPGQPTRAELEQKLGVLRERLLTPGEDHTIGRIFLELAESEFASTPADSAPPFAVAAIADAIPSYLGALEPAPSAPPRPGHEVTVTLVRWPYT